MQTIDAARHQKRVSVVKMARRIGMGEERLRRILDGRNQYVSPSEIERIAEFLELPVDDVRQEIQRECDARRVETARQSAREAA